MSVWQGTVPRWDYKDVAAATLTTTTSANPVLVHVIDKAARIFSLVNNTDKEIEVMFVNPDDPNQVKQVFTRISQGFGFGSETLNAGGTFNIDERTKIYIHAQGATVTAGKFKLLCWG